MNLNVSGIMGKLQKNADWVAGLASVYERFNGDLTWAWQWFTKDALNEVMNMLKNPQIIKYKLLDSPHAYTGIFKMSLIAYLAAEAGLIAPKYKTLAVKAMKGSGVAALVLPGSGPIPENNSHRNSSTGTSETWRYPS